MTGGKNVVRMMSRMKNCPRHPSPMFSSSVQKMWSERLERAAQNWKMALGWMVLGGRNGMWMECVPQRLDGFLSRPFCGFYDSYRVRCGEEERD